MINRVFYGSQAVFISDTKSVLNNNFMHGVQSLSIDSNPIEINFPDIGRMQRSYFDFSRTPTSLNINRVFSGFPDVFGFRLNSVPDSYESGLLLKPSNLGHSITGDDVTDIKQFDIKILYNTDLESFLNAGSDALDAIEYKRCLLSSSSINMSKDGPFTESLTFNGYIFNSVDVEIPSNDLPLHAPKIYTRKDFDKVNSILPLEVVSNTDFDEFVDGDEVYGITDISIDLNIDYQKVFNSGNWGGAVVQADVNKWTRVAIPLEVSCSFTVVARRGQQFELADTNTNFTNNQIRLVINSGPSEYMVIDLGKKNRLNAFSIEGGDTGGGLAVYRFTYQNVNNDFSMYLRTDTNFGEAEQASQIL